VTDANWLEQVRRQGIQHGGPDFGIPAYIEQCAEDMSHVLEHGRQGYGVRSASHSERETYPVFGAQTLEELAEILGYEGEAAERFLRSIERYNALCRSGKDRDFGKDPKTLLPIETPPFYGFRENNTRRGTATPTPPKGLATDNRLCVLNTDGNPIRGLYAAGNCLGGRYAVNYPTPMGGNMIGMAMTHGRWLGKQLTGQ